LDSMSPDDIKRRNSVPVGVFTVSERP